MSDLRTVALELIDPPAQSIRKHIPDDLIDELASSISAVGLIEPLVVEDLEGRFRIIAGHRRYLACRRAGVTQVDIVVRAAGGAATEAVQSHENIIRQDMNAAEEARLVGRTYAELGEDLDLTAGRLHFSPAWCSARLELLAGDPEVLDAIDREDITLGVGQLLNTIKREDYRRTCLLTAIQSGATIGLVKRWVADYNGLGAIQTGERTPQTGGTAAAPEYHPVAESLHCFFCEGTEDLDQLRMVQIHAGCIGALNALLKRIGRTE